MKTKVIGITGSFGKTSCKDLLFELLRTKYKVKKTPKSLNSESGVPLAIFNEESGFSNPLAWFKSFLGIGLRLLFDWERFDYFVVEMGVDKPGDMDYLLSFLKPQAAIFLGVQPVHTGNFNQENSLDLIYQEKKKLLQNVTGGGLVVLKADDPRVSVDSDLWQDLDHKGIQIFGLGKEIVIKNIQSNENGLYLELVFPSSDSSKPNILYLRFDHLLGKELAFTLAPAIIIARELGVPQDTIAHVAARFLLSPGRLSLIEGIKETTIIDSSYNASRYPMLLALDVLDGFSPRKKIAVLGDMRELGDLAKGEHEEVAKKAVKIANEIVLVGPLMKEFFYPKAVELGFPPEKIHHFIKAGQAASFLVNQLIKGGEVVLVKGSQNTIFLEKAVFALMKNKKEAKNLLCRQEDYWLEIKANY